MGRYGRWLKVDWRGHEVWLADWVPMTGAAGGSAVASEVAPVVIPEGVNNCCFVNWTCATDEDWQRGFHALQENQCTAPGPVVIPEGVDNCCFVNRTCTTDDEWERGYAAYHLNQCGLYPKRGGNQGIVFEGPAIFTNRLNGALDFIRERSSYWYNYIVDGLSRVKYDPSARRSAVNSRTGVWRVPPSRVESWGEMVYVVGSLAHEACHVHRRRAGLKSGGLDGERDCLEKQIAAARAIYPSGREWYIDWATGLLANIEDPDYWWWTD